MSDKTIEELQSELEELKKRNLEAELAKEKAKADEELRLAQEKETERMREEIRQELVKKIGGESKVTKEQPVKMDTDDSELEEFKSVFTKKQGITGDPYESYIKRLAWGDYKK